MLLATQLRGVEARTCRPWLQCWRPGCCHLAH